MKKSKLLPLIALSGILSAQSQNISDKLLIHDTRHLNDAPSFNSHSIRADFKIRNTIGVPGLHDYSTNLTISPWRDPSGGLHHQLNFNDGGIYYRNGSQDSQTWNKWKKILFSDDNVELEHSAMIGIALPDAFSFNNQQMGHYAMRWGTDSWNFGGPTFWLSAYGGMKFFTEAQSRFVITGGGNIGIGTENPQNKLDVAGTIRAQEIKVELTGWADYVFDKDYKLPSLQEVKSHIEEHKHLPGIPSEKQVLEEGVNMGEMQAKLLQKIEELTLYVIELKEENEQQQQLINKFMNK